MGSRLPRHGGEMEAQRGPSCPAGPLTPGAGDKEPLGAAEGLGALLSREAAARAADAWAVGGLVPPPTGWLGSRHPGGNFPRDTDVGGRGRCEGTHGCSAGLLGRWLWAGRWWGEKPAHSDGHPHFTGGTVEALRDDVPRMGQQQRGEGNPLCDSPGKGTCLRRHAPGPHAADCFCPENRTSSGCGVSCSGTLVLREPAL